MKISEHIENTIEKWSLVWKDRLKGFMASWLGWGIEIFADVFAKSASKKLRPFIESIESKVDLPPEIKPLFDEIKDPTGEFGAALANSAGSSLVGGTVGKVIDFLLRPLTYALSFIPDYILHGVSALIDLWRRQVILEPELDQLLHQHGLSDEKIAEMKILAEVRLPSQIVGPAWLRDPQKWGPYWRDVAEGGITEDRLELLKEITWEVPRIEDIVRFAVREIYHPEIAAKYGQYQDFPEEMVRDGERSGLKRVDQEKYWAAHWDLPSAGQGFEMYHRGVIDYEELQTLLRTRDIMPFWRDKITEIAWDLPNRIETRMMARYGLVDKDFIVDILTKIGLAPEYRSVVADMNISMGVRTDLSLRYSKGWINKEELRAELVATGLSEEIGNRLYQWIVKNVGEERVTNERDLTASEIIKGVKKGFLSWEEGIERLEAMGFDTDEAIYKLAINIEVELGSPETPAEFKRLTDLYRVSQGQETDRTREEIIAAEKSVAAKYPRRLKLSEEELKTRVDTIRRQRRRHDYTRDEEISELLKVGLDIKLADAYAENDDLRVRVSRG